ncbi:LytR/AlgR family response regulator transcription factor [Telluribacter humicola]|uniref:LytR/AlgR family response regulator transcription factor n=1 Tax=Telluribacter humicola TaxID=1720261 RepID=UPI001A9737F1|nr:LytTR family DNA-binding domain-containing protein [Telluribacter humicola]
MKALIVEDEELAVRKLKKLIMEVDESIDILAATAGIDETVDWLNSYQSQGNPPPDLIFMDIELADGQSFEIFDRTHIASTVIFTTSYDEYALQAFKVNSIDYLLKPIQREDLARSLKKFTDLRGKAASGAATPTINLEKLLQELQGKSSKEYRKRFLVSQGQRMVSIEVKDIAYFYTEDRFAFFRTYTNQKYLIDYTLDELEKALEPDQFYRINRGIMVSHQSVHQIHPYFGNRLSLVLNPSIDKEALVSREKVSDFKIWMGK